ncbi:MAG: HipA domain-containing protein [Sulfuritalea sp.]|jgi:serine/threonine-protein kinase HipA|nr:HipA domain-containing protein [Sulfuritalea sp.]
MISTSDEAPAQQGGRAKRARLAAADEHVLYTGMYLPEAPGAIPVGLLTLGRRGVTEYGGFEYGRLYRARDSAIALNPAFMPTGMATFNFPQRRLRDGGALNLTFKDCLPDAWGELVLRYENNWKPLSAEEMLLKTNENRVGALVFSPTHAMPSASPSTKRVRLEDLAEAARCLAFEMEVPKALKRLLVQGGTLGGARPKASLVRDHALWIAKFPAKGDEVDVQVLEACTLRLAGLCDIRVAQFKREPLQQINALLVRRFDRPGMVKDGHRIHYLSAAAFTDSPYESNKGSYVGLASQLRVHGSMVSRDLPELFRRLVFNVLIDNTDDHVKNHGVLHSGRNLYELSPAFDMVPQLSNLGYMGMAIAAGSETPHLDAVLGVAGHFGLSRAAATTTIKRIREVVAGWKTVFVAEGADDLLLRRVEHCFKEQEKIVTR